MNELKFKVKDELGIHARPAGKLVKTAAEFKSEITIECREKTGDAKRIFAVMGLGVRCGDEITFRIEGSDEDEAREKILAFLEENL